jgi:CRP/FNR family transcriptional regulator, cyclic AMP receptor protein
MEATNLNEARPLAAHRSNRDSTEPGLWLRRRLDWLPEERLRLLVGLGKLERVRARSTINVNRDAVRLVVRGAVRLEYVVNQDNATVISILGPGDLLSKLFFKEAPKVRVQAVADCVLLTLPRRPFLEAMLGSSGEELDSAVNLIFGEALVLLARYWQTLGGRLIVRLAAALLDLARKFGVEESRGTLIDVKLSQTDLARMIGCSRQQLHALMENLGQRKVVLRRGRQMIINVDEVRMLARER